LITFFCFAVIFCNSGFLPFRYGQKEEKRQFKVDAIIVATGYDLYDLSRVSEYNYDPDKNIIHAGQLERMIIGTGPTQGKVVRPSDGKVPGSVAFVLCAGSRSKNHREYCSLICCMYSMKEASLIKAKLEDPARISIFYTDIRAVGKQFEEYYSDVRSKQIRFMRGKPSDVIPTANGNAIVRFEDTLGGGVHEEEFELVVLAPAIVPNAATESIRSMLKLPTSSDGFLKEEHPKYKPVDTSVKGVFVAGCVQGPKDIPDSVAMGSGAAAEAMAAIISREQVIDLHLHMLQVFLATSLERDVLHHGIKVWIVASLLDQYAQNRDLSLLAHMDQVHLHGEGFPLR
jgi:heterodisulfide reductase subunit A